MTLTGRRTPWRRSYSCPPTPSRTSTISSWVSGRAANQLTLTREDDLYTADALSPDRPLLLAIPFVETIPNRGVSYVDADGALRQYAIVESGKDGTIFLMEEVFDSAA